MLRKFIKSQKDLKSIHNKIRFQYFNQPQNFDANKDYYKILDLNKQAKQADIKKAYYKLAKQYHPDVSKGYETKFKEISEAYQVLSNDQTKKQYDSARVFREGWSKMGSKAQQGTYSYEEYQNVFYSMSPQEREQFQKQSRTKIRRLGLILGGFFLFWSMFSRTPHKAYTEYNGTLIPVQAIAPYQYPDQYLQQPNPYQQGQPKNPYVGLPNNPYAGQPYQAPGPYGGQPQGYPAPTPTQTYGSQYPQAQYLAKHNEHIQQQPGNAYPQQQYAPVQPRSQYTVDRPQTHQPYPNSPYAERPMQSNYQPGYQTQKPKGMED